MGYAMKKLLLAMVVVGFLIPQMALSQGPMRVGGQLNIVLPIGDWSDFAGTGFGATGLFIYPFNDVISFTGQAGYISFGGQTVEGLSGSSAEWSYSVIPLMGGARYYLGSTDDGPKFFVGGDAGLQFFNFESTSTISGPFGGTFTNSASSTEFSFGPSGGVEINNFDISAVFVITDGNYFGIRAGYTVPIGE